MNVIKESMEKIQASEELKQSTLLYLDMQRDKKRSFSPHSIAIYVLTATCLFFLLGIGGYSVYRRPVSYISIDVNPSIEIGINRFQKVVSVDAYNADGWGILDHVSLKNISYTEAIDRLLNDEDYSHFLAEDSFVVITIVSDDSDAIIETIGADESLRVYKAKTYVSDRVCMEEAHQHEMSFGKYRAYQELSQYDDNITVEDCHGMTMGEIHSRIASCQNHNGAGAGHTGVKQNHHEGHHDGRK